MRIPCLVPLLTLLVGVVSIVPSSAQGLADVAKQEEARRQNVKGEGRDSAKVFSNKDLPAVPSPAAKDSSEPTKTKEAPPASASAATDAPVADAKADKSEKKPSQADAKTESYWRKRTQTLRDQLERDRMLADALQSRVNALTADVISRDDPAQRAKLSIDRQKALAELDRMKAAVSDGTKAITDLEEEARRAGVPPGWLR
jgi:hypothetical protein